MYVAGAGGGLDEGGGEGPLGQESRSSVNMASTRWWQWYCPQSGHRTVSMDTEQSSWKDSGSQGESKARRGTGKSIWMTANTTAVPGGKNDAEHSSTDTRECK